MINNSYIDLVGLNIYAGIILAELSHSWYACKRSSVAEILAIPLAIFGLYLCSFPNEYADFAPWSSQLLALGNRIVPGTDLGRFWPGLGAQLLAFAILFSPNMKSFLSHPALLWLGKVSFPVYLLHGPLMRSVLAWMVFGRAQYYQKEETNDSQEVYTIERLPLPSPVTFLFVLPFFWCFLLTVAHFWAVKVEPYFGWATKQLEDCVFDREGRSSILPVRKK